MHIVTGGAGFIGSHLVDALPDPVTVIDDLSTGQASWVRPGARLVQADAGDATVWAELAAAGPKRVWHVAADPDVRGSSVDPEAHVGRHVGPTLAVLEAMRRHDIGELAFTSTSTVYGEASVRPTPEDYGPLLPISVYGGAKLACEALVAAWCGTYGLRAQCFRFANVVGPRSTHGVTVDFVAKLRRDPARLEVLGDGTQTKSYAHVSDVVAAMLRAAEAAGPSCTAWNIGSLDAIPVTRIARIVADVMGLDPELSFTGGHGGAGWVGDVKHMGLAVDRLRTLGWEPRFTSAEAIRDTAEHIVAGT